MFKNFDFTILNDLEFKEDSVREEIVSPILKNLGYSVSGDHRIIRSRSLAHPFFYIGTTKRKINIIPDYLLKVGNQNFFILDAKAPNQKIDNGKNVEQAFSYAIHSEIRVPRYALCNGKQLTVFNITKYHPVATFEIENIEKRWREVEKLLSPFALINPAIFNFRPDFGLSIERFGFDTNTEMHFLGVWVQAIGRSSDELYAMTSSINFGDDVFAATFDFNRNQLEEFLDVIPTKNKRNKIGVGLKNWPFYINLAKEESFKINIIAKLKDEIVSVKNEEFKPLEVLKFDKI